MRGVSIKYGDVAPEAKENFVASSEQSKYDTLSQLQQYNVRYEKYGNPCELYQTVLDGTATAFPSVPEAHNLGLWSEPISDDNGEFGVPVVLDLESEGQYTSQGLTLTFDTFNGIHATRLSVKWMRKTIDGITVLDEKEYSPNSTFYFCRNFVENYNKVVITFYSINMPRNRLKLQVIDYGYGTYFSGEELRGVKLIQEIDPISSQISINTADFTLDSKSDMEYSFQAKQPLSIYYNGELKATTFVSSSKRKSRYLWEVKSEDYIGVLDSVPYYGGIYNNALAVDILEDIFAVAKVPFSISDEFANETVTGYIPYTTCREALMQVAFAIRAVVDTSNSDVVKVFSLKNEITQTIPLDRIYTGQNFNDVEPITGVEVAVHTYQPMEYVEANFLMAYDAANDGTGDNILVKFPEPLHGVYAINDCEIVSVHDNYAIINAKSSRSRLAGCKYEHTIQIRRKNREDVGASTLEKVVAVQNATLVSAYNIDNIITKCFDWLTRTQTINLKIAERKHVVYGERLKYGTGLKHGTRLKYGGRKADVITYDAPVNVGDKINAETEFLGLLKDKTIIRQSFNLNGNIVIKEAAIK